MGLRTYFGNEIFNNLYFRELLFILIVVFAMISKVPNKFRVFDDLFEGVQIIDPEFRYLYVNKVVAAQGKSSVDALLGFKMEEKYPGIEKTPVYAKIGECMGSKEPLEMINEFDFPDGSKGYFQLRFERIPEGVLLMSIDMTDHFRARKIIEDQSAVLEEEVERRMIEVDLQQKTIQDQLKELSKLNESLRHSNEKLEEFGYIVSHDLKAPIRGMSNYATFIMEDFEGELPDEAANQLQRIKDLAKKSSELIDNLFMYSKIGSEETCVEEINLNSIINGLEGDFKLHEDQPFEIEYESLPIIKMDVSRVREVFYNLISNGLKYNNSAFKKVKFSFDPLTKVLFVKDNGIGIAEKDQRKVFKMFARLNPEHEYGGGTGAGLALVQRILERNDIAISLVSEFGNGTTFQLDLSKAC